MQFDWLKFIALLFQKQHSELKLNLMWITQGCSL